MTPWAIPLLILAITALDALERFVKRFDVDVAEGDMLCPRRMVEWGTIFSDYLHPPYRPSPHDRRYVVIRLPGLHWETMPWCSPLNLKGDMRCGWMYHAWLWLGQARDRSVGMRSHWIFTRFEAYALRH